MPQVKQASKQKRGPKAAASALGAAGLTFSLLGSATASAVPTADVPQTTAFRGRIFPKRRFKCYNGASFDTVHRTLLA